jgi:hypothetical protein
MREVILNYWNWFADLVNPYHDVINTISTIVIAAFAVVLARVAWKQTRDARVLQRAYLNVKFGGIQSNFAGELRAGSGCLNKISASISGASAKVRPPCGKAAG